jgi:hypothetical protein
MRHFLCVVYVDRTLLDAMSPEERKAFERENNDYARWLAEDGRSPAFASLQEPETATLVRARDGKVSMTDGPYVETKEHLAGFMLLRVNNREEALAMVEQSPVARIGTLEIREANLRDP